MAKRYFMVLSLTELEDNEMSLSMKEIAEREGLVFASHLDLRQVWPEAIPEVVQGEAQAAGFAMGRALRAKADTRQE